MENWMEKFERARDEKHESMLNSKLSKLLNLLDEAYIDKDRLRVIIEVLKIYDELRIDACDYDRNDYVAKKKELAEIQYRKKKAEHMQELESESWNDFKSEELNNDENLER